MNPDLKLVVALLGHVCSTSCRGVMAQQEHVGGCPMGSLMGRLGTIGVTCCGPSGCGSGPIGECAQDCADVYMPFWDECGAMLAALGLDGSNEYAEFANSCQATLFPGSCGDACTATSLQCRLGEVQTACCAEDHECTADSVPIACGFECAMVLPIFLEDCGALLPPSTAEALAGVVGSCYDQDTSALLNHAYELTYEQGCALDLSGVAQRDGNGCQRWDYRGLGDSATPEASCASNTDPLTRSTCCFALESMVECEAKCDEFDDANAAFWTPTGCCSTPPVGECCCKVTTDAPITVNPGVGSQWRYAVKDSSCDASGCGMSMLHTFGCCRQPDGGLGDDPMTTYDQIESIDRCLEACEADSECTAIEFRLEDQVCEIHTTAIDHTNDGQQCVCYVKECPLGTSPGGSAGASHGILSLMNDDGDCSHADLFISEVGEGSSNNKWVELYNPRDTPMSMSGYSVLVYANGRDGSPQSEFVLDAYTIEAAGTFLICHSRTRMAGANNVEELRAVRGCHFLDDFPNGVGEFTANGDDAIVLVHANPNHGIIDSYGAIGTRPDGGSWHVDDSDGHEGEAKDHSLIRISTVTSGTPDWEGAGRHQWRQMAQNDDISVGSHITTCPASLVGGGGHRRLQLLSLLSNSPGSCPMEQLQLRVQETDRVCCPDACGGQLVPEICTPDCAVVWNDLWSECQTTLSTMVSVDSMPALAVFQDQCLSIDRHSLLRAVATAECRTYASPFPFTVEATSTSKDGVQIIGQPGTILNNYYYVTQSTAAGGTTQLGLEHVRGLSAGDVVMIVQSSDDRGSAGLFEFQVVQSVDHRSSTVELVAELAHTYTSGSESLWKNFPNAGECVDASGGIFAKGVLSEDHSVATCKALCESASELCIGIQYVPSPRTVRDSDGVCILLAISGSDPSVLEERAGSTINDWFDPADEPAAAGQLPIAMTSTTTSSSQVDLSTAQCLGMVTPAIPGSIWQPTVDGGDCTATDAIGIDRSLRSVAACEAACEDISGCVAIEFSHDTGCAFYPSACLATDSMAAGAFHIVGRLPDSVNGVDPYVGCFQDCDTMTTGAQMDRVCDDIGPTQVTSLDECTALCEGYSYMGLTCPMGTAFYCMCCNALDLNTRGTEQLNDAECTGGPLSSGIYGNNNGHCAGYPEAGNFGIGGGYHLGGACRGAIYATATAERLPTRTTQLIRVPQASSVHVLNSASVVAQPWDGRTGGFVVLMASEDIVIDGSVLADGAGYRGGSAHNDDADGSQGESYRGHGDTVSSWRANFGGGGGGEWRLWNGVSDTIGASGGGGGHATPGQRGNDCQDPADRGARGGEAGGVYGEASLDKMLFGSGGGAPADEDRTTGSPSGGSGGGVVILHSAGSVSVTQSGGVSANGATGPSQGFEWDSGVGGGGAGGSVLITANSLDIAGSVTATGGAGGGPVADWCGSAVSGGAGGDGRLRFSTDTDPTIGDAARILPRPFEESMEAAENDGCERLASDGTGKVWTAVGPLTPARYDRYDRWSGLTLDECKSICELGTTDCRETCCAGTECSPDALLDRALLPTATTTGLAPCDSIAYGPTCVTYSNNVLTDAVQTWGFDYYTVESGSSPLYIEGPGSMSWADANVYCQENHFALASVHCQAQQDLLQSVCSGNCWIGLNDIDIEGDFTWSDDSPLDFDYFAPGEPDDAARDADEDFVGMRQDLHGHWNDAPSPRSFVCSTRCPGREACP